MNDPHKQHDASIVPYTHHLSDEHLAALLKSVASEELDRLSVAIAREALARDPAMHHYELHVMRERSDTIAPWAPGGPADAGAGLEGDQAGASSEAPGGTEEPAPDARAAATGSG